MVQSSSICLKANPCLKTTQEVEPHSQLSSKRLDHIHNSHPRGWTTFTTLIQEVGPHSQISSKNIHSFMFGVEIMTIWTRSIPPFLALFWLMPTWSCVSLTIEILQSGGGGGLFTYFLKSAMKTKLNAHSLRLVGWRKNCTFIARPFLWVHYKDSKRFFRVISRPFFTMCTWRSSWGLFDYLPMKRHKFLNQTIEFLAFLTILPMKLCFLTEVWLKPSLSSLHHSILPSFVFSPSNLFTILPMVEISFVHLFLEVTPSFYIHRTWVVLDSSSRMEKLGIHQFYFWLLNIQIL
jgi:hypothetical protein